MWFAVDEYLDRIARCQKILAEKGCDYVLLFEPENITYLTGFFTEGYNTSFQFAIVPASGLPTSVVRIEEKFWFDRSPWPDRVIWWHDGETREDVVARAIGELGVSGRVAVEGGSWRAPYTLVHKTMARFPGLEFHDIDLELAALRFVKSEAEIELIRQAGRSVFAMCAAGVEVARPGTTERELASAISSAGILSGSDWADPGPISSGEAAKHIHAGFADRTIEADDLVFIETTAQVKHYHARCMRSIKIGPVTSAMQSAYGQLMVVQDRALDSVRAGVHCSVPDRLYRQGIVETKLVDYYPNKTFYSMGFMLHPNTWEPLEVTPASDFAFEAGMVFHTYMTVNGLNLSDTIVITQDGFERLTNYPRELARG